MTAEPLSMVTQAELRAVWPRLRARIDALGAREPWVAEDVFHEILVGNAYLWTTPDRTSGFVVLQVLAAPYEKALHVWIADNETAGRCGNYAEQLRAIARDNGCTRWCFETERLAFGRAIPGLQVRHLFYEDLGG